MLALAAVEAHSQRDDATLSTPPRGHLFGAADREVLALAAVEPHALPPHSSCQLTAAEGIIAHRECSCHGSPAPSRTRAGASPRGRARSLPRVNCFRRPARQGITGSVLLRCHPETAPSACRGGSPLMEVIAAPTSTLGASAPHRQLSTAATFPPPSRVVRLCTLEGSPRPAARAAWKAADYHAPASAGARD